MPRLLVQSYGNADPALMRAAAAVEAGSLAYVVANDSLTTGQSLAVRCALGAVLWFADESQLGTVN